MFFVNYYAGPQSLLAGGGGRTLGGGGHKGGGILNPGFFFQFFFKMKQIGIWRRGRFRLGVLIRRGGAIVFQTPPQKKQTRAEGGKTGISFNWRGTGEIGGFPIKKKHRGGNFDAPQVPPPAWG